MAVPFCYVANFLLHSWLRQVAAHSRELRRSGLSFPKLVLGHVDDGFLIHSSAGATVPNISTVSARS